jgi:hypothetical protein
MKAFHKLIIWFAVIYLSISGVAYAQVDTSFHIFIMFGQSNMEGQGAIEAQDRVTNPRVLMLQDSTCPNLNRTYGNWYKAAPPLNRCWGKLGPGDSFGKIMGAKAPSHLKIGLVNVSVSGCNIFIFKKGCPNGLDQYSQGIPFGCGYTWLLDLAKKAQQVGVIKGFLFHQGETNNTDPTWKYTVQQIVDDLKTDLDLGDVPFLAGELLYEEYKSCCSAHNVEINKLPGIIPNAHVISAAGLPGSDYAHFTSASYRTLGERYARKMLHLLYNICDSTTIESWYKLNGSTAVKGNKIITSSNTTLVLSPRPENALGTWSWSGAGTSGTSRQQSVNTNAEGTDTAIVVYTNECGTTSRLAIEITVCDSTHAEPWYRISEGEWIQQSTIKVLRGSELVLKPVISDSVENWSWTGTGFSENGPQLNFNTSTTGTFKVLATYINYCGTKSRLTYAISVCDSSLIESWYHINGQDEVKSDSIVAEQNSLLVLSPHPLNGTGKWNWSGFVSGSGREQAINTATTGSFTTLLTYINPCEIPSHIAIYIKVEPIIVSNQSFTDKKFIINPNPADYGRFTLSGIEKMLKIDVVDLTGSEIFSITNNGQPSIQLNVNVSPGIYLIKMYDGTNCFFKKVAIN